MPEGNLGENPPLDPNKFIDPKTTADGTPRAEVGLSRLRTLWFNTGSLCNITCLNCYMESSPKNDSLAYITLDEYLPYLDEIERDGLPVEEIAFTGGEPFMNRDLPAMIEAALEQGLQVLVLTNAMRPMLNKRPALLKIKERFGAQLSIRVSIDHYQPEKHELERGKGTWAPMIEGLTWLSEHGFDLAVAGRTYWGEDEQEARAGYRDFFNREGITVDAFDPARLVLFPEMDATLDVPEITIHCWNILGKKPESMMCSTSRMVVKRKGHAAPVVVPCTLLPYDPRFEMGRTIADASGAVSLNHPHCARFCVLGGASCSPD